MSLARYSFLSWSRRGMGAQIVDADTFGASALPLRPSVPIGIEVNSTFRIDKTVGLRGPADVVGLDARAVIRTDPRPDVCDFEPNYLVCVELYDEDLPWRYTPARATPQHRLRPWLALIVLASDEFERGPTEHAITVSNANALFPPASQTWAWAHVHVNTDLAGDPARLDGTVRANSDLAFARLLSPRRLKPSTAYTAFVLPTFESGRLAGLGLDVADDLDGSIPAWGAGQTIFPVYYEWSFRTGIAGDFESLARLLEARELDNRIGLRDMDVQSPAPGVVDGIRTPPVLGLEGALRTVDTVPTNWPQPGETFPTRLAALINAQIAVSIDPIVTPPLYGQWHAATTRMGAPDNPPWLETLNRDPRHRAAAGFGAEVIRREQERFMAAAWSQVGAVLDANRALMLAQLGRTTTASLYRRHLVDLDVDRLLAISTPLHGRIVNSALTIRERVRRSALPTAALDRSFRRIIRPAGPVARRFIGVTTRPRWSTRLNAGELAVTPVKPVPERALLMDAIVGPSHRRALTPGVARSALSVALEARPGFSVTRPGDPIERAPTTGADSPEAARFRGAFLALQANIEEAAPVHAPPKLSMQEVRTAVVNATEPSRTFAQRVLARFRVSGLDLGGRKDPLDPIMTAPEIDEPMYKPLAQLSSEVMLPNIGLVPQNTVSLLLTNNRFIESYLVGLNHEMARELLWREYPTDQRGSYFRCFWDSRDSLAARPTRDIDQIHHWPRASALGDHIAGGDDRLVLVIRGDILKKYPTAVISAVNAVWPADGGKRELGSDEHYPLFHAELAPDLTLLGFDLDLGQVKGSPDPADHSPGWFFVIKQRPGEPRFGLDETSETQTATTWDQLWWGNVAPGPNIDLVPALVDVNIADQQRWGSTAADMASILYQRPILIAIHASEMLP